jgi:hypothetical protein
VLRFATHFRTESGLLCSQQAARNGSLILSGFWYILWSYTLLGIT